QADGGTRTAAITGGFVAMHLAFQHWVETGAMESIPVSDTVSAISCGVYKGEPVADLDYDEDSDADTDANFVITGNSGIVEIQGTAEKEPFSEEEFMQLLNLAKKGCAELTAMQKDVLGL
ncbi:MAG: ribonuclease PH, partial [Pseudomonadota bacterium]